MADVTIDHEKFFEKVSRLQEAWNQQKSSLWGGADALCIPLGSSGDDVTYSKSSSFHVYFLGYEFTDSILMITKNNLYFMASAKKCQYLEKDLVGKNSNINVHILKRNSKDDGMTREQFNELANVVRKNGGKSIGSLFKADYSGNFIASWMDFIDQSQLEKVEIATPLSLFFAQKDEAELDLCKRAAVLSNKILKHGFVQEMETILDNDSKVAHEKLSTQVEEIIMDPNKIGVKVSSDSVESCYNPIIQSGGKYDIKVSATCNGDDLSPDVIICSLGARYKGYCANISRTFMVDAPTKVEKTYSTLLALYNSCLETMIPGNELKDVVENAKNFLKKRDPSLLDFLPKSLGFGIGLEFRDSVLLLNNTNSIKFSKGMTFNLSVGFHNVPLDKEDKKKSPEVIQKLNTFSLLIADVVSVQAEGVPDVLTKFSKEFSDVSYSISGDKDNDDDEGDEEGDGGDKDGAEEVRRSKRSKEERLASESAAQAREVKQKELMEKKLVEARRRIEQGDTGDGSMDDFNEADAKDLQVYKSQADFPKDVNPNRLKMDVEKEALLVPINGQLVPFHISTIKNMTQPDPDMRINFYIPGSALGKEVPKNMQQLIFKYGSKATFIKELTFRSTDGKSLATVYNQFVEVRKKIRQREQKAEQEKDLVIQEKLIRIKDQRVPRLQEVTMRPQLSGRKCVGNIEAHQNGLRFTSSKAEVLDVMYANVKHMIFQPCDKTTMVLIHFHLKDHILIGKKKQKDVQFYTEVIESSLNLEGTRRSSYDPDELDDEQREREMRKRLNLAFKEFCVKVEKLANHYEFKLKIDAPYKKSGFDGNWSKEMVTILPTSNCVVNLTEWPPLVLTLNEIEHVHFERVTYATKAFDVTFIFKNWELPPRSITAIDMKYMDTIQDWLNLIELTFTRGPRSLNWVDIMKVIREERLTFYNDKDEDGVPKPPGWLFLSADGSDEEDEEEEEESSFSGGDEDDDDDSDEDEDEDDDDESDFSEEEDDEEEDGEDDLSEKGQSWDELERDAKASDKMKRYDEGEDDQAARKKQKRR